MYECRWTDGCSKGNTFSLHDKIPVDSKTSQYNDVLRGVWENNTLSNVFFRPNNIQIIQNGIRAGVYNQSNKRFKIGSQDSDVLLIIMRSIYIQHSANQPNNIMQQVEALNKIVLDYAIPQIMGEAKGYIRYKHDVSTLAVPMSRPGYMSMAGINTYKLNDWFGNDHCGAPDDIKFKHFEETTKGNRETENTTNWERGKLNKFRENELVKIFQYQRKHGLNTECFSGSCQTALPPNSEKIIN